MRLELAVAFVFVTPLVLAQQPASAATGTVSGHVYFAGSNAPARFATVALQPIAVKSDERPYAEQLNDPQLHVYETLLGGSFLITQVPPGAYYVVVKYPGYLSPFSQFSNAELVHPTPEVQKRIEQYLPMVNVAANNNATLDVRLSRGASISGQVSFDDGTPYASAQVALLQRDAAGKWMPVRLGGSANTDEQGHFRLSGLLGGEYLLRVRLAIDDVFVSSVLGQSGSMRMMSRFSLFYYTGDTAHQRDAKSLKLDDGQDLASQTLTIPVAKIHAVSGAVVEQGTGRAVNKATVAILFADDQTQLTSASVDADDPGFHFSFVPEGEYVIKVLSASDVSREVLPPVTRPGPPVMPQRPKETVLRTYKASEAQPLTLHGDVQGLNLAVTLAPDNQVPDAKPLKAE